MKTIFIQSLPEKLFSHIKITELQNTRIVSGPYTNNIYQIFYKTNFDTILLSADSINKSILQFATEFDNKKIFIYTQNEKIEDIKEHKNIRYISYTDKDQTYLSNNIIYATRNMVNHQLYNSELLADVEKQDYIACFLEDIQILPQNIMSNLYPNSHKKIKMFNNPQIQHLQNLGIITERDRSQILKECKYYLNLNSQYKIEASIYNCEIVDPKTMETIEYTTPRYETYQSFVEEYL